MLAHTSKRAQRRARAVPHHATNHQEQQLASSPSNHHAKPPPPAFLEDLKACTRAPSLVSLYDKAPDDYSLSPALAHHYVSRELLQKRHVDAALELHARHLELHGVQALNPNVTAKLFGALVKSGSVVGTDGIVLAERLLGKLDALVAGGEAGATPLSHAVNGRIVPQLIFAKLRLSEVDAALELARRVVRGCSPAAPAALPAVGDIGDLMRAFYRARSYAGVYLCLDMVSAAGQELDGSLKLLVAQFFSNKVSFVKGGVDKESLPRSELAEVVIVGRSNVGKSSLLNYVLGKRKIVYVSKTPGKTQQYNYFLINEGFRHGSFHMVDFPGLGYAKVPKHIRQRWTSFLRRYLLERQQLRAVLHLIDSNVGVQEADEEIMRFVSEALSVRSGEREASRTAAVASAPLDYGVVLTKMDKSTSQRMRGEIKQQVIAALEAKGLPSDTPFAHTSSRTTVSKGREEVWQLLRGLVEGIERSGVETDCAASDRGSSFELDASQPGESSESWEKSETPSGSEQPVRE